jgi:short-subunit dehydrogenase
VPTLTEPPSLRGARVLVTGASSGIGAATAVAFANAGAVVGVCARRTDRLEEVRARCDALTAGARAWTADVADLASLAGLVQRVEDGLGGLEVLVNNAGIPKRRKVSRLTLADVTEVTTVNYLAPVELTLAALPGMLERRRGDVVNVSSMGAHSLAVGTAAYAASKAALELFTEALWLELVGTGVRAHLFVPGSTRTELSTPKDGNDPPFPSDPALVADPEEVADRLVACVGDERYVSFATDRDQATYDTKQRDVNGFLAAMRERLVAAGAVGPAAPAASAAPAQPG